MKEARKVLVKGKKSENKSLDYIDSLPEVMANKNMKCEGTSLDYFLNEENLISFLKKNAQHSLLHCLHLYSNKKYKDYNDWEKFYQTFQLDLVKLSQHHTYYMAGMLALNGINNMDVSFDKNVVIHLRRMLRIFCLTTIVTHSAPLGITKFFSPDQYSMLQEA